MASIAQAGAGLLLIVSAVGAQERAEPERAPGLSPLRVRMVISRASGEKKAGSLVYSFPCNSRDRKTLIKSGVEVPVPVRKADAVEFQYRNVGANIECESAAIAGGKFTLRISFEQSSLVGADGQTPAGGPTAEGVGGNPVFRTSMGQFTAILRDGQTTQAFAGTDPQTGDVTTVDVTLTALE
jgi:hypothetical protein